jgi:hypothetical protein
MTHTHDDFECPSPRDYVDTKSWLAYEQNPCSTHWVRLGSCHRETSLGYDILPAITRLQANMNIWLLHDATIPRCSELGGCSTLPQLVQSWVAASSPARLSSIVAIMTWHLHRAVAKSLRQRHHQHHSIALSPAWLSIYIVSRPSHLSNVVVSMTRQHRRQHDSASTSYCSQVTSAASSLAWLDSIVASMTQYLHRVTAKSPR